MSKSETQEQEALSTYVKLLRAAGTVSTWVDRHLADARLTSSQFAVLEALYHLGPMCQKDIGSKVQKSLANLTTVLSNLERRGLVARERLSVDRRTVLVRLTDAGWELVDQLFPRHAERVQQALAVLSAEEQSLLGELCRKLGLE